MCLAAASLVACGPKPDELPAGVNLVFARDGKPVATLDVAAMTAIVKAADVDPDDPVYKTRKHYRAVPLRPLLERAYGNLGTLKGKQFVIRATDGYAIPVTGDILTESGAYLAYRDRESDSWEPIGPRKVSPAPLYLIWGGTAQRDTAVYPWPWGVIQIDQVSSLTSLYPKTVPPESAAKGHAIFLGHCVKCHAINRQGGSVGPDLNVPKNVTEYWSIDQIKAYVKNPMTFRYGAMPANPDLTDDDISALTDYLAAMKDRKSE
jgi:mono/diheme cytochrome c family protein